MTLEPIFVYGGIFTSVVLLQSACLFLVMQFKNDNSLIDIAYGPLFFTSAFATILLTNNTGILSIIMTSLMGVWALRLSYRIGKKNWGKPEDVRYAAWRTDWMKRGHLYFSIRSLLQINLLQGLLIVLIATPFIVSLTTTTPKWSFVIFGIIVTITGLMMESMADRSIDKFIKAKQLGTTSETFLKTGLFRYSRRPNYFGETLVWWGLAIMVLGTPYGYIALIGPLTITYIVTRITGPMLEKIFIEKFGAPYKEYMKETSYFIPLPPKKHI
jgi:steroid 5-alpha reductase family enzyme